MKRLRVIEQLRRQYGGEWRWDAEFTAWRQKGGMIVEPRSHYAPLTPNGDDHFVTQYWRVDVQPVEQLVII